MATFQGGFAQETCIILQVDYTPLLFAGMRPAPTASLSDSVMRLSAGLPAGGVSQSSAFPTASAAIGVLTAGNPLDHIFGHIYLTPKSIDVGNLTGRITRDIHLWNAYFSDMNCIDVVREGMDGIDLSPDVSSFLLHGLESKDFTLIFNMDGSPVIGGYLAFDFGSVLVPTVTLQGRRVVSFVWFPQAPLTETLEWMTDIIEARDGSEQRARLRNSPRQAFKINVLAEDPSEAAAIETAIYGWQSRSWVLPVWTEHVVVNAPLPVGSTGISVDTTASDHRPAGMVMLWQSNEVNEAMQIASVASGRIEFVLPTTVAFTGPLFVVPTRMARIVGAAQREDYVHGMSRYEVDMLVIDNVEFTGSASPTQYKGVDVLTDPLLVENSSVKREIERPMTIIDYGTGVATIDVPRTYSTTGYNMRWRLDDRWSVWALRKWLHRRAGRAIPFWMATWREDLALLADIPALSVNMRVRDLSYSRLLFGCPTRKHIMVELTDGTRFYREVMGAVVGNPGEDVLSVDTAFGRIITPADIKRISWLVLHRLNGDKIELNWNRAGSATIAAPVKEIAQ